jgi:uncharacterized protein YbjT (DUF2867 family)
VFPVTEDDRPVLVLGGTGKTGRRVVSRLRAAGVPARAASRQGETWFDWNDHSGWDAALAGARAAYLVDLVDEAVAWDPDVSMGAFCERAVASGLERLVLLQARTDEEAGGKSLTGSELHVQESGLEWTVLRPTWFSQNFDEGVLLDAVRAGELRLPAGQGLEPFVDCEDVAAVAVAALTEDGHHGRTYELTGPRLLTFGDAAAEISRAAGREVRYVPLPRTEYVEELLAEGVPADYAELLADLLGQIEQGRNARLSDGVQQALGRPPMDFATYAATAAQTGAWAV